MANKQFAVQWSARHTPLTATLNTCSGILAATAVGDLAGVSPWWGAAAGIAGTAATYLTGLAKGWEWPRLPFRTGAFAAAATWSTYALATTPWSMPAFGTLGVGGLTAGMLALGVADYRRKEDAERQRRVVLASPRAKLATEWENRINRVCSIRRARVVNLEEWATGTGFTLDVDLAGGSTWKQLAAYADNLAGDAQLPQGCGVQVGPGGHRGAALVRVSTVNALMKETPYPLERAAEHGTINNPIRLGVLPDGRPAEQSYRWHSGILTGQVGSGKTNAIHVANAEFVRNVDVVLWHIDIAGGGLSLPWVRPFLDGRATRPAIDWPASSITEALAMCEAALRIIDARIRGYQDRMRAADDDKLPVDAEVPEIIIVVDEFAELPARLRELVESINGIGRRASVRTLVSALRGTAEVIPPMLKKHSRNRVGMRVSDPEELAYLFGWNGRVPDPEEAPYEGCGFIQPDGPTEVFKAHRLTPSGIDQIAVMVADRRPALDELSAAAVGEAYPKRWDVARRALLAPATTPADATEGEQRVSGAAAPAGGLGDALDRLEDSSRAIRDAIDNPAGEPEPFADELAAFRAALDSAIHTTDGKPVPEPLGAILTAFAVDPREYVATADLAAAIGRQGDNAGRDLGHELSRPPFNLKAEYRRRAEYGGKPTRGFFLADLRAAAARLTREE